MASLRLSPHSSEQDSFLPRNAIGWGDMPAHADGTFNFTILYEPEHHTRIFGLRTVALAKDATVELCIETIAEREVAVVSCEVSEEYTVPSEYRVERGF